MRCFWCKTYHVVAASLVMMFCVGGGSVLAQGALANGADTPSIHLSVHEQHVLPLRNVPARIAVGDPQVADVQPLPSTGGRANLLLVANKPGATELQVWVSDHAAPQRWRIYVAPSVAKAVQEQKPLEARVEVAGDHAVVSGSASTLLEHQRATQVAHTATGDRQIDLSTITTSGMVQVEVKVVELSRNVMKDVGLRASASGSGPWGGVMDLMPFGSLGGGFSLFYGSRNFNASLALLEQNGMARILAEPTLLALSGQSASFLSGGEIPVPESGGLGTQTVTYKPFGIGLTVTPTVISPQRIALKVAPEASELDYSNAIQVIGNDVVTLMPALRMRRADTTIELGDGETYVISGLVSRQTMANVSKIPLLGDLPIIGTFFRSMQYSQEERELVIAVTPRLVKPIAAGTPLTLPGAHQEKRDDLRNAWGYYLIGPALGEQMPGFSR